MSLNVWKEHKFYIKMWDLSQVKKLYSSFKFSASFFSFLWAVTLNWGICSLTRFLLGWLKMFGQFNNVTRSRGVWNLPHKCHLYLINIILSFFLSYVLALIQVNLRSVILKSVRTLSANFSSSVWNKRKFQACCLLNFCEWQSCL